MASDVIVPPEMTTNFSAILFSLCNMCHVIPGFVAPMFAGFVLGSVADEWQAWDIFGLRNVQDADAGLREMLRVTKPGGRLVICEFSHPTSPAISALYRFYNDRILPPVARLVSSNGDAYDYLNESIRAWSDQPALAGRIRAAGWTDVAWRNLTLGVVALHRARKPVGDGGSQPR